MDESLKKNSFLSYGARAGKKAGTNDQSKNRAE